MSNIQHNISKTLFEIFNFIEGASKNELLLREIVAMMGWELDELVGFEIEDLSDALSLLSNEVQELSVYVEEPPNEFSEFKEVLELSKSLFEHIEGLNQVVENLNFEGPGKDRLGEFAKDALKYIITLYISIKFPLFYHSAVLLTIIKAKDRLEPIAELDGNIIRRPTIFPAFEPGRIPDLLSDPIWLLKEEYFPNGLQTDKDAVNAANRLFPRIAALLNELKVTTVLGFNREYGLDFGVHGNRIMSGMLTAFAEIDIAGQEQELAISLALSPANREDLGLVIIPSGQFNFLQTIGNWGVEASMSAGTEALAIGRKEVTLLASAETTSLEAALSLSKLPKNEDSFSFLLGSLQSTYLKIGNFLISTSVNYQNDNLLLDIFAQADNSSFVLSSGDGDGFIQSILPSEGFELEFDFGIGWSNKKGLYFKGEVGMEATYPVNKSLFNIISINQLHLKLLAKDSNIGFQSSVDLGLQIGPIEAIINGIGLKADIDNLGESGNIGFGDLSIDFVPPTRVGISIDTSAVKGGGFLGIDVEKGEYTGVLELTIKETISIKAIGIITTKLPNGEEGYSFLLLITAEFNPMQLGFGFTLNGVGGLIGIHRGMNLTAIRVGVQTKALDHILFPDDPIANAPQIIANLNSIFPIAEDNHSFGLMFLIGWGVPTLLEVELGLMISFPSYDIAVIGKLSTALPDKKKPVLILNVAFAGTLSFENKYFYFDARVENTSRLLSYTLSGDMAVRMLWGDQPNFVLSVGGFHPDFEIPKGLGLENMERITLSLLADDNPRLILKCYFAITSNTVQFGATIDFYFKKSKFKVIGFFYFHALFQFSPFYFIVSIGATLDVKVGSRSILSVGVEGNLEGPTPWKVKGKGRFKIWWVKVSVSFSKTWGERIDTSLPDIAVYPELKKALLDDRNWAALLPKNSTLTTLRDIKDDIDAETEEQDALIIHPFGSLSLAQRVVPLDISIDKYGGQKPSDYKKFSVSFEIDGNRIDTNPVRDFFAPAQFFALSEDQKISKSSYDKYTAGLSDDSENLHANFKREKAVIYEFKSIDSIEERSTVKGIFLEPASHLAHWAKGTAIAKSPLGRESYLKKLVSGKQIKYTEEEFVVVQQADLSLLPEMGIGSEFEIQSLLDELLADKPEMDDKLMVVPAYEIV